MGAETVYNDQTVPKATMRLGPTSNRPPRLTEQQKLSCSNCNAEFASLQIIKINDKQLCIWCAGHPKVAMPLWTLTKVSQPAVGKRKTVYKHL
jgi:hypothetical protein